MKYLIIYTIMQLSFDPSCGCSKLEYKKIEITSIEDMDKIKGTPIKVEILPVKIEL